MFVTSLLPHKTLFIVSPLILEEHARKELNFELIFWVISGCNVFWVILGYKVGFEDDAAVLYCLPPAAANISFVRHF